MTTFTYHKDSEIITCICGKEINGEHTCNDVPKVKECNAKNCVICIEKEKQRVLDEQWYEDRDGYIRCSSCDLKCECDCDCYADNA